MLRCMLRLIPMGVLIFGVNVFIGEFLNNLPIDCDMEEVFSLSTYWLVLDVIDLKIFKLDAKLTVVGEKIIISLVAPICKICSIKKEGGGALLTI